MGKKKEKKSLGRMISTKSFAIANANAMKKKTTEIGLAYEKRAILFFNRRGFDLYHTGKVGDKGIDFEGRWILPSDKNITTNNNFNNINHNYAHEIKVAGQCKCEKRVIQSKSLREFEGSLTKHSPDVLGLFVSPLGYSKNSIKFAFTSSRPLMLATFTLGEDSSKDRLVQIAMSNSFMRLSSGLKVLYKSVVLQSVKKKRTSQYEVMTQNDSHRREMEDGKENENENEIEIENEDEIENENENENIVSNEEVERQDFVKQKIVLWYNNTRILSTDDHLQ